MGDGLPPRIAFQNGWSRSDLVPTRDQASPPHVHFTEEYMPDPVFWPFRRLTAPVRRGWGLPS